MLQVNGLAKSYGKEDLFLDVNFVIGEGEKVGLVGRNGHGKSTLFKIITGEEMADEGEVVLSKNYRIGKLAQKISFSEKSVLDEAVTALPLNERDQVYRAEKILDGLGFTSFDFKKSPQDLSGGYQIRLNLAKVLLSESHLLLLDEPTNYLDILSLRWLAKFLRTWPHEVFLITHDRDFLDSVVTHIVGIHRKKVKKLRGKTKDYYEKIALEEEVYERTRMNEEKKIKDIESFVDRFRAKATKATLVQSRVKALAKMDKKEKLDKIQNLQFSFNERPFSGKWPLVVKNLSFGYEEGKDLFNNLSFSVGKGDRLAIIGKNGKGKTTLLRVLMGELGGIGEINFHTNVKSSYFGQTNREQLTPSLKVEDEIQSVAGDLPYSRVRQICGIMMFEGDKAKKNIGVLSGGEKARVLLGKIMAQETNFLILDEPSNHLDIESCESLKESLINFGGTILLVTHNENYLRAIANKFIVFQKDKVDFFEGTYDEFLTKIGLEEESDKKTEERKKDYHLLKNKRREIISERSKVLGPLRKKVDTLEQNIIRYETEKEQINSDLIELSSQGEGSKISELSRKLDQVETKLKELYDHFDHDSTELSLKEDQFELRLKELE